MGKLIWQRILVILVMLTSLAVLTACGQEWRMTRNEPNELNIVLGDDTALVATPAAVPPTSATSDGITYKLYADKDSVVGITVGVSVHHQGDCNFEASLAPSDRTTQSGNMSLPSIPLNRKREPGWCIGHADFELPTGSYNLWMNGRAVNRITIQVIPRQTTATPATPAA